MTRFEVDHVDALGAIQGHGRIQVFLDHAIEGREAPTQGSTTGDLRRGLYHPLFLGLPLLTDYELFIPGKPALFAALPSGSEAKV